MTTAAAAHMTRGPLTVTADWLKLSKAESKFRCPFVDSCPGRDDGDGKRDAATIKRLTRPRPPGSKVAHYAAHSVRIYPLTYVPVLIWFIWQLLDEAQQ